MKTDLEENKDLLIRLQYKQDGSLRTIKEYLEIKKQFTDYEYK
jgi:hypothetical protein